MRSGRGSHRVGRSRGSRGGLGHLDSPFRSMPDRHGANHREPRQTGHDTAPKEFQIFVSDGSASLNCAFQADPQPARGPRWALRSRANLPRLCLVAPRVGLEPIRPACKKLWSGAYRRYTSVQPDGTCASTESAPQLPPGWSA